MPDTKISALTAVVTPTITDEFAVNQGGTSKKITLAQIGTGFRIDSAETFGVGSGLSFGDGDTEIFENSDDLLRFKPGLDSTTSFQFVNSVSSAVILNIDCLNRRIGIGTAAPGTSLHISDSNPLIRLQDSTGVGNAAVAFIEFYDTTVRQGVIGFGSSSSSDITVNNQVAGGNILLTTVTGGKVLIAEQIEIDGDLNHDGSNAGFFGTAPVARPVSAVDLTNNVTVGGTNDTIADYSDLSTYANDAAAIRNNFHQLARKLKQVNDGLRDLGLLT